MLLDFTVENFRSIKGAETLSAVAQKKRAGGGTSDNRRRVKSDDEIAPPYHIEGWDIDVLPVLAIFGANASGKSNILKALDYLLKFMFAGNFDHGSQLIPFKLDKQSIGSPTQFILRTAFNETIYTYSLVLNSRQIFSERLEYALASTKRDRLLYSRTWNDEEKIFDWKNGSDFSGAHNQLEKSLQIRESFISLLFKLEVKPVQPLLDWIINQLGIGISLEHDKFAVKVIKELSTLKPLTFSQLLESSKNLLRRFDTGLYDLEIRKNGEDSQIYALHETLDGETMSWEFEEESTGTQYLFGLIFNIQTYIGRSSLFVSDELGSNIHPNIICEIVRLFQNPKTNPKRTQLIFTSHDNTLQRNNLLRRDQIWFTKKRSDQSTELYSLSDFKVRNDLAIDKAYLDGRFGAVPFIPDDEDLVSTMHKDNG
ncbi:hypothetical protein Syn7502_01190 [Synechococcus sp. PCC 7502]|uniref:AAA family ATPase n=1 Tax=Synechococcus sp. PCC 7502 TaxID=1173263 RepID=UPI00029FA006|nr:ATP-binding protein [Synechococcus sp. PCC 7502]AFY73293.1 hypothetical protein Syn7502_01190 [Synechococcus sp. PCC 7502]